MGGQELENRVRDIVAGHLAVPAETLRHDVRLANDPDVDDPSTDGLLGALEQAFEARFPDDFLDGLHTVGDLSSAVRLALSA